MSSNLHAELSKLNQRTAESKKKQTDSKKKAARPRTSRPKGVTKTVQDDKKKLKAQQLLKDFKAKDIAKPAEVKPTESTLKKPQVPFRKRLKDVITCLRDSRAPMSVNEVSTKTKFEANDKELWDAVKTNVRVEVLPDGRFLYKSLLNNVKDKSQLLTHIRRHPKGTAWMDLSDAYVGVEEDLEQLKKDVQIFVLMNPDVEDNVVYPNDPRMPQIKVSEDVIELWQETRAPDEPGEMDDLLKKFKIVQATRKGVQKRVAIPKPAKQKKKREMRYRKVTNTHMPELFNFQQPDQID